jgi:uncharacterized protein YkuJ
MINTNAICITLHQLNSMQDSEGKLMESFERQSRAVADRVTVDIEGLRDEIETAYASNPLWAELSLSQKLRRLISERLEELKQDSSAKKQEGKP